MKIEVTPKQIEAVVEVFNNLSGIRNRLIGVPLTADLFDEINGSDRSIENLLGKDIDVDFGDFKSTAQLKTEIYDALTKEELEVGKVIHSSLECIASSFVNNIDCYDAYVEQNLDIRSKLVNKLTDITADQKVALGSITLDFECFSHDGCKDIVKLATALTEFFASDACNMKRMDTIRKTQGIDLTEDDIAYLKKLRELTHNTVTDAGYEKISILNDDRVANTTVAALGFTDENIIELTRAITKAELAFYKTVRNLSTVIAQSECTTDDVVVHNSRYYNTVVPICYYVKDVSNMFSSLNIQISLMLKKIDFTSASQD